MEKDLQFMLITRITVENGKITSLNIKAAMLSDIDFSVSDVTASTVVGYTMIESYKIKYTSGNKAS